MEHVCVKFGDPYYIGFFETSCGEIDRQTNKQNTQTPLKSLLMRLPSAWENIAAVVDATSSDGFLMRSEVKPADFFFIALYR